MTVRRLKKAQRGPWCSYCDVDRKRAVHRGLGFRKFACSEHLPVLTAEDKEDERMSAYETEGERQAMRGIPRA